MSEQTTLKSLEDIALIKNYQQTGKERYIAELYQRYAHLVYGSCLKYMQNRAEAQDMVSTIFIKLLAVLKDTEVKTFKTFLFTVTRNECISQLRKMKSEAKSKENFTEFEKNKENFVENDGLMRLDTETPSQEELLRAAIKQLTPDQQECISLFYFENRSYKEIVQTTNYTLSQVKSNLQNGKRNLRILLETKLK